MRVPPETAFFEIVPDCACEIVSPDSGRKDRVKKAAVYARERLGHFWLVDPLQRTLEVMRLEAGRWVVLGAYEGDSMCAPSRSSRSSWISRAGGCRNRRSSPD